MARPLVSRVLMPLFVGALFSVARSATAEEIVKCPAVDGSVPMLAEIDARRRLAFVREVMDDQARRARRWSVAWAVTGLGLAAGSYTQAALADTKDDRIDPLVGGTTSLFIPAGLLVLPLQVMHHQRTLEADLALLSSAESATSFCATLAHAEHLLAESADNEAFGAGIFTHLFVIGGNGAIALFLGLGFDHWKGALINGGGGLLISELQIFTQPTGAVTELARYRRGEIQQAAPLAAPRSIHIVPWLAQGGVGVAAFGSF